MATRSNETWAMDEDGFDRFAVQACEQYEQSAPTVAAWADDLYRRVQRQPEKVTLFELRQFNRLREEGNWMQPNYAANLAYKTYDELGFDTTGLAGY